jgi:hypothetical protein
MLEKQSTTATIETRDEMRRVQLAVASPSKADVR